jgi:hypothetical protein
MGEPLRSWGLPKLSKWRHGALGVWSLEFGVWSLELKVILPLPPYLPISLISLVSLPPYLPIPLNPQWLKEN